MTCMTPLLSALVADGARSNVALGPRSLEAALRALKRAANDDSKAKEQLFALLGDDSDADDDNAGVVVLCVAGDVAEQRLVSAVYVSIDQSSSV